MKKFVRVNALASAVGVALLGGMGFSSTVVAAQPALSAQTAVAGGVEVSSVGSYIITFAEPGLLHYSGDVAGLDATAPKTVGTRKLDVNSSASRSYAKHLETQRAVHVTAIENLLGRPLRVSHTYGIVRNGISAALSPDELAKVASAPGVVSVKPVRVFQPDTFRGPTFIGANTIWDGSGVPGGTGTKGQGMKVGIIDTGTNTAHPSFANDETCGFSQANPKLHAFDCNTSSAGVCNGPTPNAQSSGHGVHTSSTAAGNTIDNTADPGPLLPDGVSMSGVAPCAAVYSYRVESADGGLSNAAINAAIESLVADQIDVVNYSIGPGCANGTPWQDEDRDFLDAINGDVFVAASAGNTRTGCVNDPIGRVSHMGPWMLTVAASSQDETFLPRLEVTGPGTPPANVQSIPISPGSTTIVSTTPPLSDYPLRTYPANLSGCTDTGGFPANYFTGSIAVVRRGFQAPGTTACGFIEKVNNAAAAGATMVIVANNQDQIISMDTTGTTTPSFSLDTLAQSDALIAFVSANLGSAPNADTIFADGFDPATNAIGDFKQGVITEGQGDVLGGFSKRGPTPGIYADLTKPDITGPGIDILAAGRVADGNYFLNSGTSMSSPHLAGAAALVRAARPEWSVAQVKSALQTTAKSAGFQEDGTTSWNADQVGSGRVDLSKAAKAGLTLDETYQNFIDANPNGGSIDVKDLNIASVRDMECAATCTWTRKVKNSMSTAGTWNASGTGDGFTLSVTPATFNLAPGAEQELTITATPSGTLTAIKFGEVKLVEASGQSPDQHLSAAVKSGSGTPPDGISLQVDSWNTGGSLGAVGAGAGNYFVWLNRFTPDAADYPFTLDSVQTVFVGNLSGGGVGAVVGETFDIYVYQDDDNDPSNGATLVGSMQNIAVASPLASLQTITLPGGGFELDGPGDVLIAMVYRGATGGSPASNDRSTSDSGRSWLGDIVDAPPVDPDLAGQNMQLVSDVIAGYTANFVIRGHGVNAEGKQVTLANP